MTELPLIVFSAALLLSMAGTLFLAGVGAVRSRVPGSRVFLLGNLAVFFYSLGSFFEIRAANEAQTMAALTVEYVGIATIGPLWFLTTTSATRGALAVGWRNSVLLFLFPSFVILLVATNSYHHLFYTSIQLTLRGPFVIPVLGKGPFWMLNMIYMTGCLVWGSLIPLLGAWRAPRARKIPLLLLFASGVIPTTGMMLYHAGLTPWGLDIAAFCMTFTDALLAVALFRFKLLDLPPLVTDQVFDNMKEGVLVIDQRDRVIGMNPALARTLSVKVETVVGQDFGSLGLPDLRKQSDVTLVQGTVRRVFQVDRSPLRDNKKRVQGEILMFTDITQREELTERLAKMARVDELTDLTNRRGFLERLEAEADRLRRYGRGVSLGIADIDHFKRVNDTWGHNAGDAALVHVARVWTPVLRASDVLARYGGEEFVVLMPETTPEEARRLLERLRTALEESPFVWEGTTIALTASFGVASMPSPAIGTVDDLLSAADQGLYLAKDSGRNQVRG